MDELADLEQLAYKTERAAGRRLARTQGLSEAQALRRVLELSAGAAGLAALVEARTAMRQAQDARDAARAALRAAAKARHDARHDVHNSGPTAWRAWFDGSAHPNPGQCGIGAVLKGPHGITVELALDAGYGNSSEAEYRALIALLEAALQHGAAELTVYGDSRVVIDDVNGPDALAAPSLADYRAAVRTLAARLEWLSLRWVPRHKNLEADALSQRAAKRSLLTVDDADTRH
jgi:ribonuclease HI